MAIRRALLAALPVAAGLTAAPAALLGAQAATGWAPAATATIRPGAETVTGEGQCTANFVFTDAAGAVYIGQAAHCSGTGAATDTDGCTTGSLPLGTPVTVGGASRPGTLVYSSWLTMQRVRETDPDACAFNDFALVRLDPADRAKVNPTVPIWGGPTGLGTSVAPLSQVYSYGNSSLRLGIPQLSPKVGISLGDEADGWTRSVYTVTPGIPGDSGSGFLNRDGQAVGILSTLALAPLPASNGVSDLARALAYGRANGGPAVTLARGTERFDQAGLLKILG